MLGTGEFRDRDHFLAHLNEVYSGERSRPAAFRSLHAFPFALHESFSLPDMVERARGRGLPVSLTKQAKDLYRLSVGVRTSHHAGFAVPIDSYWCFFNDEQTAEVYSTVDAFARRMFPILRLAYLPSHTLVGFVGSVSKKYLDLVVTEGTIFSQDGTARIWRGPQERFSIRLMERVARQYNGKWAGVSFRCLREGHDLLSCRVYENGHLTLYSGDFTHFYEDALLGYLASADRVRRGLEGRERKQEDGQVTLSPVSLRLPKPITPAQMDSLRSEVVRRYTAAVMHAGNPMLMLQVTDSSDGSSYDVYAYGQDVKIVPLQQSTSASLGELVSVISNVLPAASLTES